MSTRTRILAVALDLFVEVGYEKTSLRDIAERIGVTKAALYYHFTRKEDILVSLIDSIVEPGRAIFESVEARPVDLDSWSTTLDKLVDLILSKRRLFLLIQRNHHVLDNLLDDDRVGRPGHPQDRIESILSNRSLPLGDRVRISASLGAILGILGSTALATEDEGELRQAILDALHDLVRVAPPG